MDASSITSVGTERPRLIGLQYLRAVAALEVVIAHALLAGHLRTPVPAFGVPLFFVLSGFLMVAITDGGSRPWPFFKDRLIRIVPLYWIATSAFALFMLVRHGLDPVHALASYLFIPVGPPGFGARFYPILNVGWTLNYEMLFYAVFALLLILPRKALLQILTLLFAGAAAASFYIPPDQAPFAFWCNPLILQFLAGAWLGRFWLQGRSMAVPLLACVLVFFLLGLATGRLRDALWLGLPCTLLVIATLELERSSAFARPIVPLRFLGDASYSIYLWHIFAIMAVDVVCRRIGAPGWTIALAGTIGGVALGVLSYLFLEAPLLRVLRRRRFRHAIAVPAGP
ncbi:acyltransferase [Sphingosinicella sp. BN140058]|uniref:acyltransferase family protein n=1 Tax=Sphingosinicella sp. BN140058 TaxID=1892855 RepID=UPI001013B434|nr:acyltransferase [Sphingosinicella sp. BN140058]QAY79561.1 acyltransferase [Sphingosinicella sp. BN140058]